MIVCLRQVCACECTCTCSNVGPHFVVLENGERRVLANKRNLRATCVCVCVARADRSSAEAAEPLTWIGAVRDGPAEVVLGTAGVVQTVRGFHHRL